MLDGACARSCPLGAALYVLRCSPVTEMPGPTPRLVHHHPAEQAVARLTAEHVHMCVKMPFKTLPRCSLCLARESVQPLGWQHLSPKPSLK